MTGILSGLTGGSGKTPSQTATDAGSAQAKADKIAIDEQRKQFDKSEARMKPWLQAGTQALGLQSDYAGVNGKQAQSLAFDSYLASPNQQMYKQSGMDMLDNNATAIGGIGNPNIINALKTQGAGWAAQDFENQYNRLAGLSNTGQATGGQIGALGQDTSSAIGNLAMNSGSAKASATIGGQQAQTAQSGQIVGAGLGVLGAMF